MGTTCSQEIDIVASDASKPSEGIKEETQPWPRLRIWGSNDGRANGCQQRRMPVNPDASSSPRTYKRQLPAVGLLPSGPGPVPAIMARRPAFRQPHRPVLSLQDGESLSAAGLSTQRLKSPVSFAPRLSTISGYR
jgi:hypothetical protein